MARKVVQLDTTTGELVVTPEMVEASEVATTPTATGIPRADGSGKVDVGWLPDAVRTVNVEEADGSPALLNIDTLVFDAGTVANLGGGKARIAGGGGDTITLQGRPIAPNAPDVGQALLWTGASWTPGSVSGGGSDWIANAQLIGLVDGVNRTFALPAPAIPNSLSVSVDSGGSLAAVPFALDAYENVVLGVSPTASGLYADGGYYGSSPAACLVDGDTTGAYWSSGFVTPVATWGLASEAAIARAEVYASTAGGFGGLATYKLEYSDDGATWLTAATAIPAGSPFVLPAQEPHGWWRITGLTRWNGYEWSAIEMILEAAMATVSTVVLDTAPAAGTIPRASFRVAPAIE